MPTVEKVSGGEVLIRSLGERFAVGDQAGVDDEEAAYLCEERGDFEIVEGVTDVEFEDDPLEGKPVADTDVSEHLDRWLDQPYDHRAEQVRAGDVDDSLGAIEDAETSQTVIDAVEERRAELEEE